MKLRAYEQQRRPAEGMIGKRRKAAKRRVVNARLRKRCTFDDRDGKTALTMRAVFKTAAAREFVVRERGAVEGGQQTISRLERYVRSMGR